MDLSILQRFLVRAAAISAVSLATSFGLRAAEAVPSKEFQIKAVFLYNFTQFVQWPATAFESPDEPFVIAVVGENPFGRALEDAVQGERVNNRPIIVQRVTRPQELKACQVLFISGSERAAVDRYLAAQQAKPVLTVGDLPGFIERGGMISFFLDGAKIRFAIDPVAVQRAGLKPSSQLLQLAKIVPADAGRTP